VPRPARHRIAAGDDDLFIPIRLERDGLTRLAAARERYRLAIDAAANLQRVTGLELVHRRLERGERFRFHARMGVVAVGGDVEVRGGCRGQRGLQSQQQGGEGEEEMVHGSLSHGTAEGLSRVYSSSRRK